MKQSDHALCYISESHLVLLAFLYNFIFNPIISVVRLEGMLAGVLLLRGAACFSVLVKRWKHSFWQAICHVSEMFKNISRTRGIIKINYFAEVLPKAYFNQHLFAGIVYRVSSCINLHSES